MLSLAFHLLRDGTQYESRRLCKAAAWATSTKPDGEAGEIGETERPYEGERDERGPHYDLGRARKQ